MSCIAHIINLIVWDGIKEYGVCINRIRNAVKYIKNSCARIQRFKDLVLNIIFRENFHCVLMFLLDGTPLMICWIQLSNLNLFWWDNST